MTPGSGAYSQCQQVCGAGLTQCGRACTNTQFDALHCGGCGRECALGESCAAGICTACPAGETMCGASCVRTDLDVNNCGGCGNVCPSGASICVGGTCAGYCPSPLQSCGGRCQDYLTDPDSCGGCGQRCDSNEVCAYAAVTPGSGAYSQCQQVCTPGLTQCGRACINTQIDALHCGGCGRECALGESCAAGICRACPAGETMCGASCVRTDLDTNNCGGCGNVCPSGASICVGGTCAGYCPSPLQSCGGRCQDYLTDPDSCGGCGQRCDSNEVCAYAAVTPGSGAYSQCQQVCTPGLTQCGRACINTQIDALHCGGCGRECALGESCAAGICTACPAGETMCGASCVRTDLDVNNCGGCGNVCPSGASICVGGSCAGYCPAPLQSCGGRCQDYLSDPDSCGGCGQRCDSNEVCAYSAVTPGSGAYSQCQQVCTPGLTQCGRACINTQIDALHCGGCGRECALGESCAAGVCTACPAGETMCGASCVRTDLDANNCGGCGNVCPAGASICVGGMCAGYCPSPLQSCGGRCQDYLTDPDSCGGCGQRCDSNEVCAYSAVTPGSGAYSQCQQVCTPGLTQCGRACANTQIDALHCGGCGHECALGEFCVSGACIHGAMH